MPIFQLTESLSVAAQITPQDIPNLAAQGFTVVVCNRPDGEVPGQATMDEIEVACNAADLIFVRYPVDAMNFPGPDIEGLGALFDDPGQSVLAYCERVPVAPICGSPHRAVTHRQRQSKQPGRLVLISAWSAPERTSLLSTDRL